MPLSNSQVHHLRSLAHKLKPVVMVGQNGLTEAVMAEIEIALNHHELIKVKLTSDRDERAAMIARISEATRAETVQKIGRILAIYRRNSKNPRVELPRK